MSTQAADTAWASSELFSPETVDARFLRVLFIVGSLLFAVSIMVPFLQFSGLEAGGGDELPERYAKLLLAETPEPEAETPEPVVEEEQVEEDQPEEEPVEEEPAEPEQEEPADTPEPTQPARSDVDIARERAEQSGISAIRDAFADLRADDSVAAITNPSSLLTTAPTSGSARTGGRVSASELTGDATRSSGGINTDRLTRSTTNTNVAQRETSRVSSPVRERSGTPGPRNQQPTQGAGGQDPSSGRSLEDVQVVFDRAKGAFYSMYNRALRRNPALRGKVVIRLTIAPGGQVTDASIVSSELGDAELEQKIINRVRLLQFGAKSVPEATFEYPIFFEPS